MQKSRCTECKGFVFSLDAAVSVILILAAIFLVIQSSFEAPTSFDYFLQSGQDAITTLGRTGYLNETIDSNSIDQAAILIRQKLLSLLPQNLDARVELKKFSLDTNSCRTSQDFESCFLQTTPLTASSGSTVPEKEVFSSKKLLVLGIQSEQCDLEVELMPKKDFFKTGIAFFSEKNQTIFFQEENPLQFDFNVIVEPSNFLVCDQNIEVTLTVSVPEAIRSPIDMILVLDRSGSMSWNGRYDTRRAWGLWVLGNVVFIADDSSGVRSIDVTNPLIPSQLDRYDPGTIIDVYGQGDYVFLADTRQTDELISIDASNPSNLIERDHLNFDFVRGLFVDSDYAYVAGERRSASDSGLVIIDVSDPNDLDRRGNLNTADPQDVFTVGDFAFFADGSGGFLVIDVSDKDDPFVVDSIATSGEAEGVFVDGNYAFVANGNNGLDVINITAPDNISISDSFDTPGDARNVFVDGNYAYVADGSSLQKIDVTDKQNIFLEREYSTPYNYREVFVRNNLAFIAADNIGLIVLNLENGNRLENAQQVAKEFVDFNGWIMPPDQIGVSSFNTQATLDQILTSNKADLNAAIDSLVSTGGTDIESGIDAANTELTGVNANPLATRFEVLLSDGQSTEGDSADAAQTAADNAITIFSVGFGEDADEDELTAIATITGGEYYHASDENALREIFNVIAREIAERASDVNISVPEIGGALVIDPGSGVIIDQNLIFEAGELASGEPWSTTYTLNFPCTHIDNCGVDAISFPGDGTQLTYIDINGISHSLDFNAQTTLDFHKRDLSVTITTGTVTSDDEVFLDVTIQNIAELDANSTDLNFFLTDLNGTLLTTASVPALCSPDTPGCTESIANFNSVFISSTGKIYATIGDGTAIRECPANNTDAIFCGMGSPVDFFEIEYFVWRK